MAIPPPGPRLPVLVHGPPARGVSGVRAGVPGRSLAANAGLAAVTELCDRLGMIGALDAAVGPVRQRDRGFGAGELQVGLGLGVEVEHAELRVLGRCDRICGWDAGHAGLGFTRSP